MDVCPSVIDILKGGKLRPHMADALLVLIPKKDNPENIREFRPISLCNISFKLVTKLLVNWLKTIMEELVLPNQNNFISHSLITIKIIICQEMIYTLMPKMGSRGG